jgi:hypothetical protein
VKFEQLAGEYRKLVQEGPDLPSEDLVATASRLLLTLRQAGEYIDEPEERELLAAWSRDVGDTIYKVTGEYPAVRIAPLQHVMAISDAQEATEESSQSTDEIPHSESLPSTPKPVPLADMGESATVPQELLSAEEAEQQRIPEESIQAPESSEVPLVSPVEGISQVTPPVVEPAVPSEQETAAEEASFAEPPHEPPTPEEPVPAPESPAEPLPPAEAAAQEEPTQMMPAGEAPESQPTEPPSPSAPLEQQAPEVPGQKPEAAAEPPPTPEEEQPFPPQAPPTRPEQAEGSTEQIEGSAANTSPAKTRRGRTARRAAVASLASAEETPAGNTAAETLKSQTPSSPSQPEVAAQPEPQEPSQPASRIIGAPQPQYTTQQYQYTTRQYPPPGGTPPPRSTPPEPTSARFDATTDGGRNQEPPGPPAGRRAGIPCVPIVIVAVVAMVLLLVLVLLLIRDGRLVLPLPPPATPRVSTPAPAFYTDDLYGFTTRYPRAIGLNLAAYTADPECKGVVFVDEADTHQPTSSAYPRFKICFVAFDTALPAGDIGGQLEARSDQVERNFLSLPERGLMRGTEVGQSRLPAREVYIRAQDRETGQNVKLYEAMVEYQHRLYAIEAADLASNWDNTWPVFRDAIAALQFADRVVPPDAPVVLP